MKPIRIKSLYIPLLIICMSLLIACSDSSDDAATHATIIPGVNAGFDSITEIATSTTADGTYTAITLDDDYTFENETVTLKENIVPAAGLYVSIKGLATTNGVSNSYTVYTFVKDNRTAVAANEFTSLAVLEVGKQNVASFNLGLTAVANKTGLTATEMSAAIMAKDRSETLTQAMRYLLNNFKDGAAVPGITTPSSINVANAAELDKIALGALAYDNWLKVEVCTTTADVESCANPATPDEVAVKKSESDSSTYTDFTRCSSCHGWDLLGEKGGYAFQTQPTDDSDYISFPHAGGVGATTTRDISVVSYTAANITKNASTNRYANNTNPSSSVVTAADWNTMVRDPVANDHPNFSSAGNNTVVPNEEIVAAMVSFLNADDAKWDKVFASINPNTTDSTIDYELLSTADATRGGQFYAHTCFRCHGAPNNQGPNPFNGGQSGVVRNLMTYLDTPSSLSKLRHVAQWGRAGTLRMTRNRLGFPDSSNIADLIAYLKDVKEGTITDGIGFTGAGDAVAGQAIYDENCAGCHKVSEYDTEALCFSRTTGALLAGDTCTTSDANASDLNQRSFGMQRDLSEVSSIMGNVTKLSFKDINDLAAFFRSDTATTAPTAP